MQLFNTLTRQLEEFKPINPPKVSFYQCGPTVYWTQHIGNMRAMVMSDLIRRSLMYLGYQVTFVRNYTDVGHLVSDADTGEDKMEIAVKREALSPDQIADKYIAIFENDIQLLNINPPNYAPRATQYIKQIIDMIQILLDKKQVYVTKQAIYFDVSTFPKYNRLNKQKIEMNKKGVGKGTANDPDKKHFADFALWFFKTGTHQNALQTWDSPWGIGFPGWHIECSAMTRELLGQTIDIHMGGVEHISIHHTNEIAQSESANGVKFVNYWLHNEHLTIKGGKMAKSEGTGFSLQEIIDKGYDPLTLRYFFLSAHYRTRQDFSFEALDASQKALENLKQNVVSLKKQTSRTELSPEKLKQIDDYRTRFINSLNNDIQIPQALGVVWELIKSNIPSCDKLDLILDFDQVLGLKLNEVQEQKIPQNIIDLAEKRRKAKSEGNFQESDNLRHQIKKMGYIIEDTPEGYQIKKSNP